MRHLLRLFHDKRASTAVEYGLIAALISLAVTTTLMAFGAQFGRTFAVAAQTMQADPPAGDPATGSFRNVEVKASDRGDGTGGILVAAPPLHDPDAATLP